MPLFSDPSLHPPTPLRVQPRVGQWGGEGTATTRYKRMVRLLVPIILMAVLTGLFFLGWHFYEQVKGFTG